MDDQLDSAGKYLDRFRNEDDPVEALAFVIRLIIEYLKAERKKKQ